MASGKAEIKLQGTQLSGTGEVWQYHDGIGLGGNEQGTAIQKTSTLKVQVTDSDGAVGHATYKVNWHLPQE